MGFLKKEKSSSAEEPNIIRLQTDLKSEENQYMSGLSKYADLIIPCGIDVTNPNYINVDGAYISCLLCVNLPYRVPRNFLDEIVNYGEGVEVCMMHRPENKAEAIKQITYFLGFTKVKMQQGDNQIDSGTQENAHAHSLEMKKRLAEGDDFWYFNLLVKVTAESAEQLNVKLRIVEGILAGKDIFYKAAQFRQAEAFLSTLPIHKTDKDIKEITERNILSSGLCGLYPFVSSSLSDPEGIFVGINAHDNSQVIIDIFETYKYNNANMILMGGSGSGKTFLTQMIAGRFRMQKIPVMMICPLKGHEYKKLCDNVGGNFIRLAAGVKTTINIMEIRPIKKIENDYMDESLLAAKLQKLQITLSLMCPGITPRQLQALDAPLKRVYEKKGITMDNASLYQDTGTPNSGTFALFPKLKDMPILEDVHNEIKDMEDLKDVAEAMRPFIDGSLACFNAQTNVNLNNLYTVSDISDMPKQFIPLAMFIVLEVYLARIQADVTQKAALILDEVWKLIGTSGNAMAAEFVLEAFKIIRGYGGAAIAATQDISDFMALEGGKYGKGIISNSAIKIAMKFEEQEAEVVQSILKLSEAETIKLTHFAKGEGLLYAGSNRLAVNFIPFESEKRLITTDRREILKYREERSNGIL